MTAFGNNTKQMKYCGQHHNLLSPFGFSSNFLIFFNRHEAKITNSVVKILLKQTSYPFKIYLPPRETGCMEKQFLMEILNYFVF